MDSKVSICQHCITVALTTEGVWGAPRSTVLLLGTVQGSGYASLLSTEEAALGKVCPLVHPTDEREHCHKPKRELQHGLGTGAPDI